MIKLHELEKKLKEQYSKYSGKPNEDESQQKLNELFYNSILALIKAADTSSKNKSNFSKPFVQTKTPRKRNPFGSG
ncbi:MAG: hypothetical protein M3R36_01215 [Bacteroidota bacterium]|nr:hypothetical protein [Bacteroidota bacterium]